MTGREPLLTAATVTSLVAAMLGLLFAFGVPLTDEQRQAILGLTAVVAPFVVALAARGRVTPTADPRDDDGHRLVVDPPVSGQGL